LSVVDCWMC